MKFARTLNRNLGKLLTNFGAETITKGSHLEKLCLIDDGVGRDLISDFVTNLIKGYLQRYTQAFARGHLTDGQRRTVAVDKVAFNYETETWAADRFELPYIGDDYVLLTPRDLLTRDDAWINRSDLVREFDDIVASVADGQLRAQFNNYLASRLPKLPRGKRLACKKSGATVNGALVMLRMVLEDAVEEFDLPKNPSRRVRRLPVRKPTDEEPNLLTGSELGRVLTWLAANEPDHHPLAATLALTGLRYGEATALKWADLDADAGIIRVRRAQWHGVVSTTKTGTSRTVPLVGELADTLQKHRARLLAEQAAGLGEGWVFPGPGGELLRPNALRFPLRRALKSCGITKRVSVHGLRRTFNNLARQVAGEIVTRSITGHVTAAMTEHYSHVDAREKLAAASKILLLLAPASQVGDQVGDRTDPPTSLESERATTLRTS